jgi:transposase
LELNWPLPDDSSLQAALGPGPRPPKIPSSLEPYRSVVEDFLKQKVEMVAIWQRLRDSHGYPGSYSSVRRFVGHLEQSEPEVFTRVHTAPGEEMQVDFGSVGPAV